MASRTSPGRPLCAHQDAVPWPERLALARSMLVPVQHAHQRLPGPFRGCPSRDRPGSCGIDYIRSRSVFCARWYGRNGDELHISVLRLTHPQVKSSLSSVLGGSSLPEPFPKDSLPSLPFWTRRSHRSAAIALSSYKWHASRLWKALLPATMCQQTARCQCSWLSTLSWTVKI